MGARIFWILSSAALLCGCANTIAVPEGRKDTLTVYVLDLGRHSRIAFERSGGGVVEYAYGEWRWYALMEDAWWRVPATLFWPTRGTLGRREWPGPGAEAALRAAHRSATVLALPAERERVTAVAARLDREFAQEADRQVRNEVYGLRFIPWDRDYWLFHNSNHAVGEWLRACGFRVTGPGLFAEWQRAD